VGGEDATIVTGSGLASDALPPQSATVTRTRPAAVGVAGAGTPALIAPAGAVKIGNQVDPESVENSTTTGAE
jgi:hypothetical protein